MTFFESLIAFFLAAIAHDDAACISAGLLVGEGNANLWGALIGCLIGALLADALWVSVGRFPGSWLVRSFSLGSSQRMEYATRWIARRGPAVVFIARFLPLVRTPLQIAIGTLSPRIWPLVPYFVAAALLRTVLLVGGVWLLGHYVQDYLAADGIWRWTALLLLGIAVLLAVYGGAYLTTRRLPKRDAVPDRDEQSASTEHGHAATIESQPYDGPVQSLKPVSDP